MKRLFDIVVSFIGLIIFSPAILFICILIKMTDPGNIIYRHVRVGLNAKPFVLFKFRTMREVKLAIAGSFEPGNTTRVTPLGRFLRRTKLDEIPQLFNVLIGDMSLVGPRPEVSKWVSVYPDRWGKILKVRPGITDNASIYFRNEESMLAGSPDPEKTYKEEILPVKLAFYEAYICKRSMFYDCKLIVRTLLAVLFR